MSQRPIIAILEITKQAKEMLSYQRSWRPYLGGREVPVPSISTSRTKGVTMIAKVDITGVGAYSPDDATKKYINKKIGKLDRLAPRHARKSIHAEVKIAEVNRDKGNKYEVEVILTVPDRQMTAKDSMTPHWQPSTSLRRSSLLSYVNTKVKPYLISAVGEYLLASSEVLPANCS